MNRNTLIIAMTVLMLGILLAGVFYVKSNVNAITEATAPLFIGPTPAPTPSTSLTPAPQEKELPQ